MSKYDLFEYIQETYRGVNAYADSLPEPLLKKIHIETGLDKAVSKAISKGRSIVLTGNPGDGKTHLLRVLAGKIKSANSKAVIELDASERLNADIIKSWKKADRSGVPFCIAVNEAVLFELAQDNPKFDSVVDAQRQVEHAIAYKERGSKPPKAPAGSVAVFDLSRRNVLSSDVVKSVFKKFSKATQPAECSGIFEVEQHATLMQCDLFLERIQLLFDRIARRRFHCTLRELQGFVGFLLGKGLPLESLANESGNEDNFLSELVFSGEGALFDALRNGFDPMRVCHPVWDTRIVSNELPPSSWDSEDAELFHAADVDAIEDVERRRRRFYFFNKNGSKLVDISDDLDSSFAELLESKNERDVLRDLIAKINGAFHFKQASDEIRVWKSHRYDHETERMLYSSFSVKRRELEVLHPQLSATMSEAFEFLVDHLVIQVKDNPQTRLLVDFEMYEFLCHTDFGASVVSISNHLTRRLWQFMERLSAIAPKDDLEVEALVLDLQTNELLEVVIDTDEARYISIQST